MIPPPPGQQATTERHTALTPLLDRVFPIDQCEDWRGDVWVDVLLGRRRTINAVDEAAS